MNVSQNVPPSSPIRNLVDCLVGNVVHPRDSIPAQSISQQSPNLHNVGFCQLGLPLSCAARRFTSTLLQHVLSVVLWRSNKHMRGVYAARVVARVAEEQAIGDRSVEEFVRKSVGANSEVGCPKISIAAIGGRPHPKPAGFSLVHKRPKPALNLPLGAGEFTPTPHVAEVFFVNTLLLSDVNRLPAVVASVGRLRGANSLSLCLKHDVLPFKGVVNRWGSGSSRCPIAILTILVAAGIFLSGCQTQYREVTFKRATFHYSSGAFSVQDHTIYEFEDGSKRVIPGIVRDLPAPGTRLRIAL